MRIVRFASPQGMSFGVLDGDGNVAQIEGHPFGQISFTGTRYARSYCRMSVREAAATTGCLRMVRSFSGATLRKSLR